LVNLIALGKALRLKRAKAGGLQRAKLGARLADVALAEYVHTQVY